MANSITVELCMGSSCFARGNSETLQAVEAYIAENGLEDKIELVGHLCLGKCNQGPNVRIAGADYSGLAADEVVAKIARALEE